MTLNQHEELSVVVAAEDAPEVEGFAQQSPPPQNVTDNFTWIDWLYIAKTKNPLGQKNDGTGWKV